MLKLNSAQAHIFIAEPDPNIGMLIEYILVDAGYRVTRVADGLSAMDLISSGTAPDLVLLNLSMPFLDGHLLLSTIRNSSRDWADVPVILISVRSSEQVVVRALNAGANDYLTAPFHLDEIVARVRRQLERAIPSSPLSHEQPYSGHDGRRAAAVH